MTSTSKAKSSNKRIRDKRVAKAWRKANRDYLAACSRKWRLDHPAQHLIHQRRANLKRYYGIIPEEKARMLKAQGGRCGICGTKNFGRQKRVHIDHNHKTKKVRGILCAKCNVGGGCFHDSPAMLRKAAQWFSRLGRKSMRARTADRA